MNPLASTLTHSASRSSLQNSQATRAIADAQKTLANRLSEKLGMSPDALDNKNASDYTPDKVAGRILDFIGQRLEAAEASGADTTELKKLMSQARDGVEKGFDEAKKILDGMGALQGKVATDIDATYQKIQDGLAEFDKKYGTGEPTSTDTATISEAAATANKGLTAQADTFDMEIVTNDGDKLKVSIAQASADWNDVEAVDGSNSSGSLRIGGWQVDVEGELDDEERASLEKLFGQVQDLSDSFYSGDMAGAFDRALALDMDGSQLASLSLRLTQTSIRQATDTYGSVAGQSGQPASAVNGSLTEYAQQLMDALRSANEVAQDPDSTLKQLLSGGFSLDSRFDQDSLDKAGSLNGRLIDGLRGVLDSALVPTDTRTTGDA
jgi:hypothetical protein